MEQRSVEAIARALNEADVRYLVVGGLAVVAHGHVRLTADVDLVLDPDPVALTRAIQALSSLGYRPRAPVPFEAFADPMQRAAWVRDKGITVFSLQSPDHKATEVDLFVETPFDFDSTFLRGVTLEVAKGVPATFVSVQDLIAMKRESGRPQDREDVAALLALREESGDE